MPINWKTITAVSAGSVVAGLGLTLHILYRDLYKEFPNLDRKIIRKAYNKSLVNGVRGKYSPDADPATVFLAEFEKVSKSA